ncbi:hypothetical protein R3I93_022878 [Phoxinus phoxinus]|uniref:LRAT domain-containing protein n=1 Tax=Phoxinus phoxinus TaxID=58324 RepID=A0AAN9C5P9_9TELE
MKMLRMKCVLIAVFLQLCFSAHVVKAYQFGDMLEFPIPDNKLPLYKHYAVYVGGDETVKDKDKEQNIFEMIRKPTPGCRFDTQPGPFTVNNYLDGQHKPQSTADMIRTIEELMSDEKCKNYDLIKGNCEQFATMVRYGKAFCYQKGTIAGPAAAGVEKAKASMGRKKRREASAAA